MKTRYILLISAIVSVIFSGLASVIPLGFYNQWEVSALYPTLIVPATYTFSIWSIIYLSWFGLWALQASWNIEISRQNSIILWAAQILSSLWLIPSQYLLTWISLIVIVWVLYLLMILFFESRNESTIFKIITDLFLWWIIVASLANLHLVLVSYDIYFYPLQLTTISIWAGVFLNMYLIIKYKSYTPSLVLIWALIWIIIWQDNIVTQLNSWVGILIIIAVYAQDYLWFNKSQKTQIETL